MDWIPDPAPRSTTGTGPNSSPFSTWSSPALWLQAPPSIFTLPPMPQFSPACCWPPSAPLTTASPTFLAPAIAKCEQDLGSAGNQFWAALWEQAAAQGQTSFVAAGDAGPAACDNFNLPKPAQHGPAVNGFASTPWNVAVGGTDFFYSSYNGTAAAQGTELATYWNLTPSGITSPATSLLKPVPEQPWNQAFGLDLYDGGAYNSNQPTIVPGSGRP